MHKIIGKNSKQWAMGVSNYHASTRAWSLLAHTENVFGKRTKMTDNEQPVTLGRPVKEFQSFGRDEANEEHINTKSQPTHEENVRFDQ